MKDRPILFSGPMVRAILDGRKTQTRRVVKPQPSHYLPEWPPHYDAATGGAMWGSIRGDHGVACPYGKPGDQLWVRETGWERPERTPKMMRDGADTWKRFYYDADELSEQDHADFKAWGFTRRPSIFMPRWASRITLEVTGVRVERLQDASDLDARAEGCPNPPTLNGVLSNGLEWYRRLWDTINAKRAPWASNPWVWVVEFKRA